MTDGAPSRCLRTKSAPQRLDGETHEENDDHGTVAVGQTVSDRARETERPGHRAQLQRWLAGWQLESAVNCDNDPIRRDQPLAARRLIDGLAPGTAECSGLPCRLTFELTCA